MDKPSMNPAKVKAISEERRMREQLLTLQKMAATGRLNQCWRSR